jgi:uncharacterized protein
MSRTVFLLGISTLILFGLAGFAIIYFFHDRTFFEILFWGEALWVQLIAGVIYGIISAFIALGIINQPFFNKEKIYYSKLFSGLNLNLPGIIFISLCAGIGEEILFRGALQPLLGLWLTSIIFVAIHGYLNPLNWRVSIYGAAMVFIIAGMGYLFETIGLISAMTAHAVFDFILLRKLV